DGVFHAGPVIRAFVMDGFEIAEHLSCLGGFEPYHKKVARKSRAKRLRIRPDANCARKSRIRNGEAAATRPCRRPHCCAATTLHPNKAWSDEVHPFSLADINRARPGQEDEAMAFL